MSWPIIQVRQGLLSEEKDLTTRVNSGDSDPAVSARLTEVYTELEEETLWRHGAIFPDVPPDLRPNGYYG